MPLEIVMPKLGLTMAEGFIVEWKKNEGDPVRKGEILFVLETEKVTYEVEATDDGILGRIIVPEKETVAVGAIVGYLLKAGEKVSDLETTGKGPQEIGKVGIALDHPPGSSEESVRRAGEEPGASHRVNASPLAKKRARSFGLALSAIRGTGPGGRIIAVDVERAEQEPVKGISFPSIDDGVATGTELQPFTGMRRAIAKKMLASKRDTAQTYMSHTVDAGRIVQYRQQILSEIQEIHGVRVTITDIVIKLTAAAIQRHPIINTRWTDSGVLYLDNVHMGMAMALDQGLIVPVIRDVKGKSLAQIALERVELIRKGKDQALLPDDIAGSTFTVSTLGMFGIEQFTANINLPENAILAVGAILDKPVAREGEVVIRPMMNVTLSYDHRTIDGAEAGKFMRTLKSFFEDPVSILEGHRPAQVSGKKKLIVIGGGVGGYPAAITAARMGADVTLIEKELIGGVCLNWGCIPTKTLLQSCQVIRTVSESECFGIRCGDYQYDLKAIMQRKNAVREQLRTGVEKLLAAKAIKVVKGTADLLDAKTVQLRETGEKMVCDGMIIATGSSPRRLHIEGAEGPGIWTSKDLLEMKRLPRRAVIIGGGYIGVEFAQILHRLGANVTILEMMGHLIPGADMEISAALEKRLVEEGVKVFTHARVDGIKHDKRKRTVHFAVNDRHEKCVADRVIISVGRTPDLSALEDGTLRLATKDGAIVVNHRMETNVSGIYAVGDVVGGVMLAHVATREGECAAKNAMGLSTTMRYGAIPSCIYTSPEVASVGLSEEAAREKYHIRVGRFPFHGSGKALVLNETYGMVKIISENRTGKVLGVHIIGPHATDLIAEAVLGISKEMTVEEIAHAVHPHPTLSETIMESALTLCGGAIHMP
jgi:dihydrolipoamide dehydrogenase/pyruvate dehydrogenase complex dihydrolipoamide acetyltransferase long form